MIGKITRGTRVGDIAAYLHGPGKANEHAYAGQLGGAVIGGNIGMEGDRNGQFWAPILRQAAATRPEIKKPIWHASLRCAPDDRRLADHEWAAAAQMVAEKMGFAEHPWVAIRHADDHIHIVTSRISDTGEVWHAKNDYRALQAARQEVEKAFGLEQTTSRSKESAKRPEDYRVKQGERAVGLATDTAPSRVRLAARVRAAVDVTTGLGRETFEHALDALGVLWKRNEASTGKISGYSYAERDHQDADRHHVWFKASQLDRALAWAKVERQIELASRAADPSVGKRRSFERLASYKQRTDAAATSALSNSVAGGICAAREGLAEQFSELADWWKRTPLVSVEKQRNDRDRARYRRISEEVAASFGPKRQDTTAGVQPAEGQRRLGRRAADLERD